ncbi:MAG TPA: cobalamin-dependent protein [Bacillota bacterium]|jgi:corrinoid protein of di/trimethylamine methyltransferase
MTDKPACLDRITAIVIEGLIEDADAAVKEALKEGAEPLEIVEKGLVPGIEEAGSRFARGDYFLPELVASAEAMQTAMAVIDPLLRAKHEARKTLGHVLLGTVEGDIHTIGKNIVGALLQAAGFTVTDLGANVPVDAFVAKSKELKPDFVGMSALLTTTMPKQQQTIEALAAAGARGGLKVIVGGAPVTGDWAKKIGADAYAEDAVAAVNVAKKLLGS